MNKGIRKETTVNVNQILGALTRYHAVGCIVSNVGVSAVNNANSAFNGKKMVFAGTPLAGDLLHRDANNAFTVADSNNAANVVGVLLHDVCVDEGPVGDATCLAGGVVNVDRIRPEANAANMITANIVTALKGKVEFIKDN